MQQTSPELREMLVTNAHSMGVDSMSEFGWTDDHNRAVYSPGEGAMEHRGVFEVCGCW